MAKKIINFVAGIGQLSFGSFIDKKTKTPCLIVSEYLNDKFKIGTEVPDKSLATREISIYFKNLESLEVLEAEIKTIKKELIWQRK